MKIFAGFFLTICVISISIFVVGKNATAIDVVRQYFELSKNQKIEEASQLWRGTDPIKKDAPVVASKDGNEKFRFDISYSKEILENQYEILDFKEFPKSDDTTVLCLSLQTKGQRKLVFRVELVSIGKKWKINAMKNANEDVLAVIHKDCSTVDF